MNSKRIKKKGSHENPSGLHRLAYQILELANQGLLRTDFQREVSKRLIDFAGCDAIDLWLKDHDKYYYSESFRRSGRSRIGFRTLPPCDALKWKSPAAPGDYSTCTLPLTVDHERIGLLRLKSRRKDYFTSKRISLYKGFGQILGIAFVHRRIQVDLRERVKELTCLYEIARLGAHPDLSTEAILRGIVELLPPAWLHPEITSARIILDQKSYPSSHFQKGVSQQQGEIVLNGQTRGVVEVTYSEERPELDEGPFMKEERDLIDAVAKEIAIILKRRQDEEEKGRLEEQLRHADRLVTIGQLAAGVAHELNEPLGSILGFAQLAKKCPDIPSQAEQDIDKILNASLHARDVVKKLLIFARQMPPAKIPVNVNQLIEEGLYFFESRCAKEGIELVRSLAQDLPRIEADPSQLNQVLVNLVVNALQAMPGGGRLTIKTLRNGNHVSLIVEDTGMGMKKEVLEKIFTPFYTTKDVGEGTGLGLPVVHGIVTSHGGSIRVESKEGMGARFEIRLPLKGSGQMRKNNSDVLRS